MEEPTQKRKRNFRPHDPGNAVYGFGLIGAAVYFVSQASGFWMSVLAILKAIVWPAFLVYELFQFLRP